MIHNSNPKNMKQKIKQTLMAIVGLLLSTTTFAHDCEISGVFYNVDFYNGTLEVTYKGANMYSYSNEYSGDVRIPASIANYWGNHETLYVTSISDHAFYLCEGLTNITWYNNSIKTIGKSAFSGCKGLTTITIPNSVISIGKNVFYGCVGLSQIKVDSGNSIYDSRNNCNAIIETASNTLVAGCKATKIPNTVTAIGDNAFLCQSLSSISIPNSVTLIGNRAFESCDLNSITIPNSVTYIGKDAFCYCQSLTSATLSNSISAINDYTFQNCEKLTSIQIPNSVTKIGEMAFYKCYSMTSVSLGDSVNTIGEDAFTSCKSLTSIFIPNSVNSIGEDAFYHTPELTEVNISNLSAWCNIQFANASANPLHKTSIDQHKIFKLNNIKIRNLVIPNNVTRIKQYAFMDFDSLQSVVIPNSVISIDRNAFYGCNGLYSIILGNSIDTLHTGSLYTYSNLEKIVSLNITPPACESNNVFYDGNYSTTTLYVPKDSFSKYFIHDVWGKFANIKKIETVASEINLSNTEVEMVRGENITLSATIIPSNTTLTDLSWVSSNTDIAIVDQTGKITALKPGKVTITVSALDGSDVVATCDITVKGARIKLSHTEVSLPVNDIMALTYTVTPSNTPVEWLTSNQNVAYLKINSDGSVTVVGMADGEAIVTATATDGSGASASCVVTVGVGGIEGVETDDNAVEVARYDIHGRLLSEPTRGINIIKMSDGTTRKEIVK